MKSLEKKNENLINENKHLETKIMALEQRFNETEQKNLSNKIEVAGVPYKQEENLQLITKNIATKLNVDSSTIKSVKRIKGKGENTEGILHIEMKEECDATSWTQTARTANLVVSDVLPTYTGEESKSRIYVRRALTPYNKTLLYQAKKELKEAYKFIWCNYEGKILARKSENSKILSIRFQDDIKNLLK
ncbi:hypothetical protein JYU34_001095 [Plutella xylostella]|uniref:Uncharacterized protein n=1 Tax=Plutella xylostella TaxID=51655 RepID=A0ABQ7R624_PLUXY|nr:hypothetical protein JYU34_001095 [Plutella xylostella]